MPYMREPFLVINFKNYLEIAGDGSLRLAMVAEEVSRDLGVEIAVAPPLPMLSSVVDRVSIPVFSQHIDCVSPGSTTGHIVVEIVKGAGASGSIVNHSERRIRLACIRDVVKGLRELGMVSLVCARSTREVSMISRLSPDYVAIEPPELIGSGVAVSKARPGIITGSVEAASRANPGVRVICGAGIVSYEDVKRAVELGSKGVLVASGIVKAKDWRAKIEELAKGLLG